MASPRGLLEIKLIYEEGDPRHAPKVRKLIIQEGENTLSLNLLRESFSLHISQALSYYDDDGDQISIYSDRELQSAILERRKPSDCLRLYVSQDVMGRRPETRKTGIFKRSCTNCRSLIGQCIYKCVICKDVELCGRCEVFGVHSFHDILRLRSDKSYPSQFFLRLHRLYDKMNQTQSLMSLHPLSSPPPLGSIPDSEPRSVMEDYELINAEAAPLTVRQLSKSQESLISNELKPLSLPPIGGGGGEGGDSDSGTGYRGVLQAPLTVLLKDEFQVHEAREANSEEIAGSLRGLRKEIDKLLVEEETPETPAPIKTEDLIKQDSTGTESNSCPYDLIKVISYEETNEEEEAGSSSKEKPDNYESTPSSSRFSPTKTPPSNYVPGPYSSRAYRNYLNDSSNTYSLKYNSSPYVTTNQKISDSLETMKAMGFSDDDGWLTQILTMERGNIEKVLDILTPVDK